MDPDAYDAGTAQKWGRELERLAPAHDDQDVYDFVAFKVTNPYFRDPGAIKPHHVLQELPAWAADGRPRWHSQAKSWERARWYLEHYDADTLRAGLRGEGVLADDWDFIQWMNRSVLFGGEPPAEEQEEPEPPAHVIDLDGWREGAGEGTDEKDDSWPKFGV